MVSTADWCVGRWHHVLPLFGIDKKFLKNEHGPCPVCEGTDRFRFDDKNGRGTWFCNACGSGDGFDLITRYTGREFKDVAAEIGKYFRVNGTPPPDKGAFKPARSVEDKRKFLNSVWTGAQDEPIALQYLSHRGISDATLKVLEDVRGHRSLAYKETRTSPVEYLPAVVSLVRNPEGDPVSIHRTYLKPDGNREKKLMPGMDTVAGAAIRLVRARTRSLIIAEGIESALSARQVITGTDDYAVWAAISANGLRDVVLPNKLEHLIICSDCDRTYTGQAASYELARRMTLAPEAVRPKLVTVLMPGEIGQDMNDILTNGGAGSMQVNKNVE